MKNTIKLLLAVAALGAATMAQAISIPSTGSVKLSQTGVDGGLEAGAFKAEVGTETFYTFCVQRDALIGVPGTFSYVLSNETKAGVALTEGTAYLFKKFSLGQLFSIEPANSALAGAFQLAVWYFQGEATALEVAGNTFVGMAVGLLGGSAMDAYAGTEVRVMQLTNVRGKAVQDQLVYVPDSGATLALLGLGLAAMAIARRRRNA